MHNPVVLEQRKFDEEIDRHAIANRFKNDLTILRTITAPGITFDLLSGDCHATPSLQMNLLE